MRGRRRRTSGVSPGPQIELKVDRSLDGYWDRARVRQVVSNLVANANANANVHGAGDASVTVTAAGTDQWVRIDVHKIGEPIPAEKHGEIFDPLRRLRKSGERGSISRVGIGVGLFILNKVAEPHRTCAAGGGLMPTKPRASILLHFY
ncbi:ATP-binding protein [Caballeronia sp. BCC1704]|uniref:ATP-binding protein n=1 Tax=Caballeronia sp. BCC1704 TaxID=2676300 RepID=UPI00244612FA|nr:ATP-binding protein [Caballeronia sp. BCC1704]